MSEADNIHSSRRENLIEHLFIGEVLRYLWLKGYKNVDVLRAETDASGYDVVIEANSVLRHIQLKSSANDAKTSSQSINVELWNKPSGCVVWVRFDANDFSLGPYKWYGGSPGSPLSTVSEHTKLRRSKRSTANAQGVKPERKNTCVLNKGDFKDLKTIADLVERLFDIPAQGC
jgi:hypothetical protein